MRPEISEFSYGFALTRELVESPGMQTAAAPVFPTLVQEGQAGGGWDVRLDRPGLPLFIQFKLCHWMITTKCREATQAGFHTPCYRMHLRPARVSKQHQLLLNLENDGRAVYYCAPQFHRPTELNSAFRSGTVRSRTFWTRPSEIGTLPDDSEHHFSFERPGNRRARFSDYKEIETGREFSAVAQSLERLLKIQGELALQPERLEELLRVLRAIVGKRAPSRSEDGTLEPEPSDRSTPLQRVAYYASMFFESQLFVVQGK